MDLIARVIKMGIKVSKSNSEKEDGYLLEELPARAQAAVEVIAEETFRELHALLPPKRGDTEWDEEDVVERLNEFMKAGGCGESFTALTDCMDKTGFLKCLHHLPALKKCIDAHSDYYQPIVTLTKTSVHRTIKELVVSEHDADVTAKKQLEEEIVNWIWTGDWIPIFNRSKPA